MTEHEDVDVELVGGPSDWSGKTVRMPVDLERPREEIGAYLISSDTPPRGGDEDEDPRAVYEPDPVPADPCRWVFRGWFPSSPSDPSPDWYG